MFRRFLVFCAVSSVPFAVSTQVQAQPLPDRLPLAGIVVDSANQPVADALVSMRRQDDIGSYGFWGGEARADGSGRFSFPLAEEGQYYFNFSAPGFAIKENFALNWKKGASPPRLQLARLINLTLKLSASDGSPLANQPVFVRLRGDVTAGLAQIIARPQSDANGTIRLDSLAPARYSLWASAGEEFVLQTLEVGAPNALQSGEITLQKGASVAVSTRENEGRALGGAQLTLVPLDAAEAARLGGPLSEPDENYALLAAGNDASRLVTLDGEGTMKIDGLAPAKYLATLSLSGYDNLPAREIELKAGETFAFDVGLPSRKLAALQLQITDLNGKPLANSALSLRLLSIAQDGTLRDNAPDFPAGQAPDLDLMAPGVLNRRVTTDSGGRAALYPLKPGRYRVFASKSRAADAPNSANPESLGNDVDLLSATSAELKLAVP